MMRAIDDNGLDEEIRCEMCKNPMHTDRGCDGNCKYDEKLYERIMQILSERITPLPSAQPEYRMDEWCTDCKEYDHERHCCPRFNHVIRTTLQEAQERKKGKWITHEVKSFDGCHTGRYFDECSECGKLTTEWRKVTEYHRWNFCPNCGAKMEVEE